MPLENEFSDDQQKLLRSIRPSKVILPTLIGLIVIAYIVSRQLNLEEFNKIDWNTHAVIWLGVALLIYVLRHLLIAWRLRLLSENEFSWEKSIELVFILEFASAVSPTNFGGSAVAFFMLIQETISGARATAIVVYTIVADTLIFVVTIPLLALLIGMKAFRPELLAASEFDGLGYTLLLVWVIMAVYGILFLYGLFIKPKHLKWLLNIFGSWKIFGKTRKRIRKAAEDIEITALGISSKPASFHWKAGWMTIASWICRFFSISAILIALSPELKPSFMDHIILLSRGESLYAVTAYSPTPGGSGVAELIFGSFYSDFVPKNVSVLSAILWRAITYYPYLFLGILIIPNWIRKIINRRRLKS
jgi:uncharacterized protein (TIRG00374 family)